jgi:phage portal protein BeeE
VSLIRRAAERRTVQPFGDSSIPTNGSLAHMTASGVLVNDQQAMQLIALQACVRIISNTLASLPIRAMQQQGQILVPVERQPTIVVDPFGGASSASWLTRRDGIKQLATSAPLRGNGYAVVTARDYLFRPSAAGGVPPRHREASTSTTTAPGSTTSTGSGSTPRTWCT